MASNRHIYAFSVFVALSFVPAGFGAGDARGRVAYPAKYEGGSLHLGQHKVKASIINGEVILLQHGQRVGVPLDTITRISCGTDVHRRFGATVLAVVPLTHLDRVEEHYIGITWKDRTTGNGKAVEAVFRLTGSQYLELLGALEHATGLHAINAGKVATVVRYQL